MTYLNENGTGIKILDEDIRLALIPFVKMKMERLRAYNKDCRALL